MKYLTLLSLVLISLAPSWSQDTTLPKLEDLVTPPASPEASAFKKYGETEVSMYTGSPSISIPIANLAGRKYSFPITLTYDASGVKVDQIATSVGLGWNITNTGVVTRNQRGRPDDYIEPPSPPYFPYYSDNVWRVNGSLNYQVNDSYEMVRSTNVIEGNSYDPGILDEYFNFIDQVQKRQIDAEPDTYSFNINGLSGTLYIDYETGTAYCVEKPDLKVEPILASPDTEGMQKLLSWKITDAQGTVYEFNNPETTISGQLGANDEFDKFYSAWYITKITTRNGDDIVDFHYSNPVAWDNDQSLSSSDMRREKDSELSIYGQTCISEVGLKLSSTPIFKIEQFELDSISINNQTSARFIYSTTERSDLGGKNKLEEIIVDHGPLGESETIKLVQSYFGNTQHEHTCRLRLDEVEFYGSGSTAVNKYELDYFAGTMPARGSNAQDWWGYYNGQDGNTTLIPYNNSYTFLGGDRSPSLSSTKVGALSSITYPTGGKTEFHYKFHRDNAYWSEVEEYLVGEFQLTGQVDYLDSAGYLICDDATSGPPIELISTFAIAEAGDYKIKVTKTGTHDPAHSYQEMQFASVYSGSIDLCTLLDATTSTSGVYYVQNSVGSFLSVDSLTATLPASPLYAVRILNNSPDVTITVRITGSRTLTGYGSDQGGLRIHKVVNKTSETEIAGTKYYYYDDLNLEDPQNVDVNFLETSTNSSGIFQGRYSYESTFFKVFNEKDNNGNYTNNEGFCNCTDRYSNNRLSGSGNIVTYSKVSEVAVDGNGNMNGFTVNEYYNELENPVTGTFIKKEFLNGNLKSSTVYNSDFEKLQETKNNYTKTLQNYGLSGVNFTTQETWKHCMVLDSSSSDPTKESYHYVFDMESPGVNSEGMPILAYDDCDDANIIAFFGADQGKHKKRQYYLQSYHITLDDVEQVVHDGATSRIQLTENTYSSQHFQLSKIETWGHNNEHIETLVYYPEDMVTQQSALQDLIDDHVIAEPVKVEMYKDNNLLSSKYTLYQSGRPSKIQISKGTNPLEDRLEVVAYDGFGNIREARNKENVAQSFLWGYNGSKQIAQAINASYTEIYVENFEEHGNAVENISNAHTGKKYLNSSSFTLPGGVGGTGFLMDYWYYDGSDWIAVVAVPHSSTIDVASLGGTRIDNVRVYPESATMTSYTHDPRAGITSQIDPNGLVMFYEYDDFFRLNLIRDQDGNILKSFEYNYQDNDQY